MSRCLENRTKPIPIAQAAHREHTAPLAHPDPRWPLLPPMPLVPPAWQALVEAPFVHPAAVAATCQSKTVPNPPTG